jgi:hypothetical protein
LKPPEREHLPLPRIGMQAHPEQVDQMMLGREPEWSSFGL